jgi:hypothetical protein
MGNWKVKKLTPKTLEYGRVSTADRDLGKLHIEIFIFDNNRELGR